MKRFISIVLLLTLVLSSFSFAVADRENTVISLGKNLSETEQKEILNLFGADEETRIIYVTNEEEREYFGEFIDSKLLGSRAISSVYVEKLPQGEGITVDSRNISWVTNDMYRNAAVTAGIKDAKIVVAAPFEVSGTAALTGIIKAFEDITGEEIANLDKQVASEEIARTATLGSEIGQKEAEELIANIKMYIIKNGITRKGSIKQVVEEMAAELGIELSQEQKDQIISLMRGISKLDLDIEEIKGQLKDIAGKIDRISKENIEIRSLLERILDFIANLFSRFFK